MLGFQLTYVICPFCRIVDSNYFNRVIILVYQFRTFFDGINSLRGCSKIKMAMIQCCLIERRLIEPGAVWIVFDFFYKTFIRFVNR